MSTTDFDRRLNDWFDAAEPSQIPARLLPTVFRQVAQTGQARGPLHRFAAALEQAWAPRSVVLKSVALVALTALLLAALLAAALAAGFRPPVEPGVVDGLIAVEDAQDEALALDQLPHQLIRFIDPQTGEDAFTTPASVPSCGAHFSPNGSEYAFLYGVANADGSSDVFVALAPVQADAKPRLLERKPGQAYFDPSWAPDSSAFVMTEEVVVDGVNSRELRIEPADGTPGRRITDIQTSYAADWSTSGEWIAFVGIGPVHDIFAIRPDGTDLQLLRPSGGDSVAWSPLRDELAYTAYDGTLHVIALDGHELFDMADGQAPTSADQVGAGDLIPVWSPDATKIALVSDGALRLFDLASHSVTKVRTPTIVTSAAWSADGRSLVAVTTGDDANAGDLWEVFLDGSEPRHIAQHVQAHCMADGKALSWQEVKR